MSRWAGSEEDAARPAFAGNRITASNLYQVKAVSGSCIGHPVEDRSSGRKGDGLGPERVRMIKLLSDEVGRLDVPIQRVHIGQQPSQRLHTHQSRVSDAHPDERTRTRAG